MKKITLTKEDFSFVCPLNIEDMNVVDGGHFCDKCEKKIHDVTNMSQEDFQTLKRNSENICVSIKKVAAVSLVLGLSACSSPKPLIGKVAASSPCDSNITKNNVNNRLTPFTVVDKNKTIIIDHIVEPQIVGEPVAEIEVPRPLKEEKR